MRLADLLDPARLAALAPRGFEGGFDGEVGLWAAAARRLVDLGHGAAEPVVAVFVPGRLEVCGKHTDYAGGRSLTGAIERGFYLTIARGRDREPRLHDLGRGETARLDLAGDLATAPGHWTGYAHAVARRLRRDLGLESPGVDMVFSSTLPPAAGLSSSSALVIAAWWALRAGLDGEITPEERDRAWLAGYLAAVEAGRPAPPPIPAASSLRKGLPTPHGTVGDPGVGTRGGSQDHTAILCSREGRLRRYTYDPTRLEGEIELPPGQLFAIAASGVRAEKTAGARAAYNRAADLAADLARRWRAETGGDEPHLAAILARGPGEAETLARLAAEGPDGAGTRRLEHFRAESEEIVPAASAALAAGDLAAFGRLIDRSQRLAESLLANQVAETVHLAADARELGAHAASSFGAGFGGAVWALIDQREVEGFLDAWRARYAEVFPRRSPEAAFFLTRPGPAAFELPAG